MGKFEEKLTTVTIFNQTFRIRSDDDSQYVQELASYVDKKMSEVAEQTLNIADNYVSKREEYEQLERNVSDSTGRLNRYLISSLDKMGSS